MPHFTRLLTTDSYYKSNSHNNTTNCNPQTYFSDNIESDKVCHQSHGIRRITTGLDGLIVKENNYFDNLSGKYEFTCHFEVETGFTQAPGILVVFQKLNLRQNPNTGECIDYVKVSSILFYLSINNTT